MTRLDKCRSLCVFLAISMMRWLMPVFILKENVYESLIHSNQIVIHALTSWLKENEVS